MFMRKILIASLPLLFLALTACGSSGSSGGTSTFEPRYAYVLNQADPSVSWYLINEHTGDPRHLGYLYLGELADSVHDMVLHPDGTALYVSDPDGQAIHMLAVNSATGRLTYEALTQLDRSTYEMEIDPASQFLIVTQGQGGSGEMERIMVLPVETDDFPVIADTPIDTLEADFIPPQEGKIALAPSGELLFQALMGQVATFTVANDGSIEFLSMTDPDRSVQDLMVDPAGDHLYAVARSSGSSDNVFVYAILDGNTLDLVGGASIPDDQITVTAAPYGLEFYSLNDDGIVTVGTFDADAGELSVAELGDTADPARTDVTWVAAEPTGQFLFTATSGVDDGESLGVTAIENLAAADYKPRFGSIARATPSRIVFATGDPIEITGAHLYAADWSETSSQIERFVIEPDGALTSPVVNDEGHDGVRGLAILPGLDILFSAHQQETGNVGGVRASIIDQTNGTLSDGVVSLFPSGSSWYLDPVDLVAEPSRRFLYAATSRASEDDDGFIWAYAYSRDSHNLARNIGRSTPATDYLALAVDPAGRFIYAATEQNEILGWTLDETEARLDSSLTSISITGPTALTVSPNGAFLITVTDNGASSQVAGYRISAADGELALINDQDLAAPGVAVDMHPSGQWVYAISRDDGTNENHLEVFSLAEDGTLSTEPMFTDTGTSAASVYASVVTHPLGTALYVTRESSISEGSILRYDIDPETGEISQEAIFEGFTVQRPRRLAIHSILQ